MIIIRSSLLCTAMLCASSIAWGMSFDEFVQKSTQMLEEQGKEAEAMTLADAVLAQGADGNPLYASFAYFVKCWVYAREGDLKAAHQQADLAIKHTGEKYAYMAKSLVYEKEGRPDAALRICLDGSAKLHNEDMRTICERRYGGTDMGHDAPAVSDQ